MGAVLPPLHVPVNPKVVEPDGAREPFHAALATLTEAPLVVRVPLHSWLMV